MTNYTLICANNTTNNNSLFFSENRERKSTKIKIRTSTNNAYSYAIMSFIWNRDL